MSKAVIKLHKKSKIVLLFGIIAIAIICFLISRNGKEQYDVAKSIFNIDIGSYQVVHEADNLDSKQYGGSYMAILELDEKDKDSFCKDVEERFGEGLTKEAAIELYGDSIKNIIDNEVAEDAIIYYRPCSPQRVVKDATGVPKTVLINIVCSPMEDGKYKAWLYYAE